MNIIVDSIRHDYMRLRQFGTIGVHPVTHGFIVRGDVAISDEEYEFEMPLNEDERRQLEAILETVKARVASRFAPAD